jgi:hypothetical protein
MSIGDIVTVRNFPSQYIICKVHTDVWNRYDIIDLETGYLHRAIGGGQLETFIPFGHNLTDKVTKKT